jgi:hypothetical protein
VNASSSKQQTTTTLGALLTFVIVSIALAILGMMVRTLGKVIGLGCA